MSQENVEVVRRSIEAQNRAWKAHCRNPRSIADAIRDDDLDPELRALWGFLHPEAVWDTGDFGTARGHLEIAAMWDEVFEIATDYAVSLRELVDCGDDRVYAVADRTITTKGSGLRGTFPVSVVITIRDGLITRVDQYEDRHAALEAAGLSE